MDTSQLSNYVANSIMILEVALLLLAAWRRLWERLPFFFSYLVSLVLLDLIRAYVLNHSGYHSAAYSWTYWMTQMIFVMARGAALADLCRATLARYTGVWQLARYLLAGAAALILGLAGVRTGGTPHIQSYVIFVEREMEFAIVLTLLLLLTLSRYYGAAMERPLRGIAMGLALYSTIVVVCNTIQIGRLGLTDDAFPLVRQLAFAAAVLVWIYALRRPLAEVVKWAPWSNHERNSQLVSERMQELNALLSELMKR
jgi:hypothetical protein